MSIPSRVCRKKTGPGESRWISQAMHGEERRGQHEQQAEAPTMSMQRLSSATSAGSAPVAARRAAGLRRVHRGVRADGVEQPRHDVDLHVEFAQRADELEQLLVPVVARTRR